MTQFKMVVQAKDASLGWCHEFETGSPVMARQYAKKQTARWADVPWFHAMLLFQSRPARASDVSGVECDWQQIAAYLIHREDVVDEHLNDNGKTG